MSLTSTYGSGVNHHEGFTHPFMQKVITLIDANIENNEFNVCDLSDALNMSRSNLFRKIKRFSGKSVTEFICNRRLKYAYPLIQNDDLQVAEVAYMLGFNSPSYFTKRFRNYYGVLPSTLRNQQIYSPVTI